MELRQFTPHKPVPYVQITPQKQKIHPDVSVKHDDLYARAWECENQRLIFDNDYDIAATPKSPKIAVRSDLAAHKMIITRGLTRIFFPNGWIMWRNRYVFPHETYCENEFGTTQQYEIRSRSESKTWLHWWLQILKSWAALVCSTERIRRYSEKSQERATEPIRIISEISAYLFADFPWRLTDLLLSPTCFKNTAVITMFIAVFRSGSCYSLEYSFFDGSTEYYIQ